MTEEERITALEAKVAALTTLLETYFSPHTKVAFDQAISGANMTLAEDP